MYVEVRGELLHEGLVVTGNEIQTKLLESIYHEVSVDVRL